MRQQNILIIVIVLAVATLAVLAFGGGWFNQQSTEEETARTTMTTDNMPSTPMNEEKNIIDIASSDPRFSTLTTAVIEAGLVEVLSGEGPFTVFAPTDEAFSKLPNETLQAVLADKEQLTAILTYHVLSGKVMSEDVVKISSAETVQGGELKIEVVGNSVMVNNARVIITDIEASNGVIHVIDTVLIPQ
jgi:uncharacterized surface protein with fasciclin (FAS1) repeats